MGNHRYQGNSKHLSGKRLSRKVPRQGFSAWFKILFMLVFFAGMAGTLAWYKKDEVKLWLKSLRPEAASVPDPQVAPTDSSPLTPEEMAMNKVLENPDLFANEEVSTEPEKFELNRSSVVSFLLYHDFTSKGRATDMVMRTEKFREQMQALKDAEIPVIPLKDVLAWRKGEKNLPDYSVVITIDDGWLGVYEEAFPILKEFGYPFTVFLYNKYVNIGGRSLTIDQIKEMMQFGGDMQSHSVSHADMVSAKRNRSPEAYLQWVKNEFEASRAFLKEKLDIDATVFAFPFGRYNNELVEIGKQSGYEMLTTVNGSKTTWDTPIHEVGRFVILGNNDANFKLATTWRGLDATAGDRLAVSGVDASSSPTKANSEPVLEVRPRNGEKIDQRLPRIEANLSALGDLDPKSIKMSVSGFGAVIPDYDPNSSVISFQVPQPLRKDVCEVSIQFLRKGHTKPENVQWSFEVDQLQAYLKLSDAIWEQVQKEKQEKTSSQ